MSDKYLIPTLIFACSFSINGQNIKLKFEVKNTSDFIELKKVEVNGRWGSTKVYFNRNGQEEYVGELQGKVDAVEGIFYGKKYSGMQNYKLSIIYKKNSSGLYFFSADRLLDNPNIYFPYKLENGLWITTTVAQRGFTEFNSSSNPKTQIAEIFWYNAKLFTIKYKIPKNGIGIEPKTFAEIDGMVTWLKSEGNDFVPEKNNMMKIENDR